MVSEWQNRSLSDRYSPYIMTGVIYIKISENYRVFSKRCHIAVGTSADGEPEINGFVIKNLERDETCSLFFDYLKTRGLEGMEMVISDSKKGLVKAIKKSFLNASWQRYQVHFMRNILSCIPKKESKPFREVFKALFKLTDIEIARKAKKSIVNDYIE